MKLGLRIWIFIIVLLLALLSIAPWKALEDGVLIKSVELNSTTFEQGLRQGQIIHSVDGKKIGGIEDYAGIMSEKNYSGESIKTTFSTDQGEFILFSDRPTERTVSSIPKSNIKTGLDLSGGSRALVKAKDKELSPSELSELIDVVSNRLNVYGIADIKISSISDLTGNNFMMVEIAGATTADLKSLISQQGKFEGKIGNETAFVGGEQDIASVCRNDATCAGIEGCPQSNDGNYYCNFRFSITLSADAAQKHADITGKLGISLNNSEYLDKSLDLYVDDNFVESLYISKDLKGRAEPQISIQGAGTGTSEEEAYNNAKEEMKKLQTILITGSLPYQLEIVKLDTISPSLGESFTKNIILLGLVVFLIISIVLFVKYRKIKLTASVILTMFSEAFITIGIAAFIGWNLDAPSIAGIIAGMGTGVNDQIVILDESFFNKQISLKERIKKAFFIIIGAFFTIVAAMLPLFWAGAGLLKGFAITTIIGISVGVFITRPAFGEIVKRMGD